MAVTQLQTLTVKLIQIKVDHKRSTVNSGYKEKHFYSLPFGQAEPSVY